MIGESTETSVETTPEASTPPETETQAPETTTQEGQEGAQEAPADPEAPPEPGDKPEAKEKAEKPEKPPKKFKFKVDGAEREFSEEEVSDRVNKAELHQKWQEKIRLADDQAKEAQKLKGSAERIVTALRQRGPKVLEDLLTADYNDSDRAQDEVVKMLEAYLEPIYRDREQPQHVREAARAKRDAEKYRERLERLEREREEERTKTQAQREHEESEKARIQFEDQIVSEMNSLKIPNDRISEIIYRDARKIADETGTSLTAKNYAIMIQAGRKKFGLDKPPAAQTAAVAPASETSAQEGVEAKTPDEIRLENLAKAREKLAQTRKPDKVSTTPGFPKPRRIITTDDVREKLGID